MNNCNSQISVPKNEPVLNYMPESNETKELKKALSSLSGVETEVSPIINGKAVRTGKTDAITQPHKYQHKLGLYHKAGPEEVRSAIKGAMAVAKDWAAMPASSRAAIFLKAAELLSTKYRPILNAATMLGQSKTCYQAEIDSACEMIDFLRFNCYFQEQMYSMQPLSGPGMWNHMEYRPLEGFVFAVTPFNFTAIAGNLTTSAALLGNVVVWKPASTAVYSGHFIMKLLEEAGLPPGVIQFVPGSGAAVGDLCLKDPNLAGVHFTGSTGVFQDMWKNIGNQIHHYRSYPRIVGETGGKDFVFAHPSADVEGLVANTIRGAFEYQGQKCSAASRAYIPKSLWKEVKERIIAEVKTIKMGDVADFRNFMGAVIDKKSFDNIRRYIEGVKNSSEAEIIVGGNCRDEEGYFVEPTIIETKNPAYQTMCEEIFGPVLTVYAYDDDKYEETLRICDATSPYALTGCIWAQDRKAIDTALRILHQSAGNFYINNKPTGAVVGQQPFGGARGSGTNDKAGSLLNLLRWVSVRTVSETFAPPKNYRYPFMA
ncbi:MAG: L-glutamate gamma-semialdehyde dehydrogenase [Deltaproteobacteria bacterium]|nr:L-glutamate gamma-semialdehyde dehydrogenase [Deltaproteobacteria bacterium]